MNIVRSLLISLAGAAAAASLAAVGCSTTNNIDNGGGTSGLGESCTRTFDCQAKLVCLGNTCVAAAVTEVDGGDAGISTSGPHLGLLNESCQRSSDCQSPLECIGGRCGPASYNLTATGKSCTGECNMPSDCCEMPVSFTPSLPTWYDQDAGFVPHYLPQSNIRCEDLLDYLGGSTAVCVGATSTSEVAQGCFLYDAYCSCMTNNPWSCTNNQCVYSAPCTTNGATLGGCPSETRTARGLSTTCSNSGNGAATGTCSSGCTVDSDCDGKYPPTGGNHYCGQADAGGENCTCNQSACYFKCSKDLDCAAGYSCDSATSLCKQTPCTTDQNCILTTGKPQARCMAGQCQVQCQSDIECSTSIGTGGNTSICSGGVCKTAGCSNDGDCASSSLSLVNSPHTLCIPTPAAAATYTSAITN